MNAIGFELTGSPLDADGSKAMIAAYDAFARAQRHSDVLADFFGRADASIVWRRNYALSAEAAKVVSTLKSLSRREAVRMSADEQGFFDGFVVEVV